jgi:uncharacterized protein YihD (DUF1040 family)
MTLLEHLNKVSIERGFRNFRHLTDDGLVYVVEDVIETAGKDYARECVVASLEKASENAEIISKEHKLKNCTPNTILLDEVDKQSITNENNIILL